MDKYLSVITNFGCHGRYNYCMSCAQRKGFIKNDY